MCPPGTDQTTRSPPRWNLLAPQLEQRLELPAGTQKRGRQGPVEFLQRGLSWNAFEKLASIPAAAGVRPPSLLPSLAQPLSPGRASTLELLPSEILLAIIAALEISDRLALALCSQVLWRHVVGELQSALRRQTPPWAGTPIICTGTWLEDLPVTLVALYPELREKIAKWRGSAQAYMSPARSWNWDTYRYADVDEVDLEHQYRSAFWDQVGVSGIAEELHDELDSTLQRHHLCNFDLTPGLWVLRNLNTREVVRIELSGVDEDGNVQAAVRGIPWLTTDYMLVERISWMVDGLGVAGDPFLYAGMWAGHCFDIVPASTVSSSEGWKDVTRKVIKRALQGRICQGLEGPVKSKRC